MNIVNMGEEEYEAARRAMRSGWLTLGEETRKFEASFADYTGAKHAIAVSSGTAALHLALVSLGIGPGDEVICPALTFVATANAVLYVGAKPVFVDIEGPWSWNVSPAEIELAVTPATKAVIVVHYAGFGANMAEIMELARKKNIAVIEDAAHAAGSRDREGRHLGTIGDVGCFSFFMNKNMTTGEGGMVVTNRDDLADKIRKLRSHGITHPSLGAQRGYTVTYDVVALGYNYRMDEIRAAIGSVQLSRLDENNRLRRERYLQYIEELKGIEGISIPFTEGDYGKPSYHLFPTMLSEARARPHLINHLRAKGVQTSIHYPLIVDFSYHRKLEGASSAGVPFSRLVSSTELTLPLYSSMSEKAVSYVAQSVREFLVGK